jgi:hypothetical protein
MKQLLQRPSKIATVKTITEEQWIKTEGTVEILITSWRPLQSLITCQGEVLASFRYGVQSNEVPMDWYLTLLYLLVAGEELPPIALCGMWMVEKVYRHFLQETMAIRMSLHPPLTQERRRISVDSDEN